VASASVTVPPLAAVWLRLEPELDEEQEIEPERVTRGVIAAARAASPNATRPDDALTGPAQPRRAKPAESAITEAGDEAEADRAATTAASTAVVGGTITAAPEPRAESTGSPDSQDSPDSPDSPEPPESPASPPSPPEPSRAANPPG